MKRGRHQAARAPLPIVAAVIALVVAIGAASAVLRGNGDGPGPVVMQTPESDASPSPPASPPASLETTPSRDPKPQPEPSPEPSRPLLIHGTGDVNVDPENIPNLRANGHGYAWSGLGGLFKRDDLTVINLECAVSKLGSPAAKEFTFRGDLAALPAMRAAGIEAANLGNNHSQDFGTQAMLDTRENLLKNGIQPVGVGENLAQATRAALFEVKGWKVAVLGFGGVVPSYTWLAGADHPGMASGDDIPTMVRAVKAAGRLADIVVVSIHWGVELDTQPRADDVARAHAMIDAGADAIFGHHSHRLNPMGTYKGRPIFWGLGNFVWPRMSDAGATTAVAQVRVGPKGRVQGRLLPAFIESSGHPVLRGQ